MIGNFAPCRAVRGPSSSDRPVRPRTLGKPGRSSTEIKLPGGGVGKRLGDTFGESGKPLAPSPRRLLTAGPIGVESASSRPAELYQRSLIMTPRDALPRFSALSVRRRRVARRLPGGGAQFRRLPPRPGGQLHRRRPATRGHGVHPRPYPGGRHPGLRRVDAGPSGNLSIGGNQKGRRSSRRGGYFFLRERVFGFGAAPGPSTSLTIASRASSYP